MYLTRDETSISPNLKVLSLDCVNLFLKDIIVKAFMAQIMFYDWFLFKLKKKITRDRFCKLFIYVLSDFNNPQKTRKKFLNWNPNIKSALELYQIESWT